MAYFNPVPISFQPSPMIMQGASAIGDTMQKLYAQNYQEAQDKAKAQQWADQFGLQQKTFDHTVENDANKDKQWQTSFDAGREDKQTANEQWQSKMLQDNMFHDDTVKYQNSSLGLQRDAYGLQKDEAARKQAQSVAMGGYLYNTNPEIQKTFQTPVVPPDNYTTGNQLIRDVVYGLGNSAPIPTPVEPVRYTKPNDATLAGIGGLLPILAKENDPIRTLNANIAQQNLEINKGKAETAQKNIDNDNKQNAINSLKKSLASDPKSVLGIDPKNLTDEDYSMFMQDVNSGNVGKIEHVAGKFSGTNPKYIPHQSSSQSTTQTPEQPQQKQVMETRITEDGKKIAKYADGSYGYL